MKETSKLIEGRHTEAVYRCVHRGRHECKRLIITGLETATTQPTLRHLESQTHRRRHRKFFLQTDHSVQLVSLQQAVPTNRTIQILVQIMYVQN